MGWNYIRSLLSNWLRRSSRLPQGFILHVRGMYNPVRHLEVTRMGDPMYHKQLHGDDVGTRLSHMMDLQQLWSDVYGILTRPTLFHTELEKARALQLEIALSLLQNHITAEFDETRYARVINDLPKAKEP